MKITEQPSKYRHLEKMMLDAIELPTTFGVSPEAQTILLKYGNVKEALDHIETTGK